MADDTYISEAAAMRILLDADMSSVGARMVLAHSLKQAFDGADYYPSRYIYKRANQYAAQHANDEA